MSSKYTCELCAKQFSQKVDYTRHKKKKSPCVSLSALSEMVQQADAKKEARSDLDRTIDMCLNILRDSEGITGEKALRNISFLLVLKLIEPQIASGQIDIIGYNQYEFDDDATRDKLLDIVRFSRLACEKEDNLMNNLTLLWTDVLSVHPTTRGVFFKGKWFDIEKSATFYKIIKKMHEVDLSDTPYDVLGEAYENVIKHIMTGKVFGQFFTQPTVKSIMVDLVNPQIHEDGTIETCGDPTMGTGGFLISHLKHILEQAKTRGITPNWDFIKTEGLYGKEIDPATCQLANSNMLISTGHMFEHLERGDSIREPITRKFDIVLANPPYGIKGLNYDEITSAIKDEYIPISSDNAVSLFMQAIICMLKVGGRCAVVLPADGKELSSRTNASLVQVREYLLKTCDLKEVIYLPPGIFTNTTIKTCIFYFVKKREGSDVLKVVKKGTASKVARTYTFSKTLQTSTIKFYESNPYEGVKILLGEVPIERIVENKYSLSYSTYAEVEEIVVSAGMQVKRLSEVCEFMPKSKRPASYGNKSGLYPFYSSSQTLTKYCDEYDYEDECLIIGTGGVANIKCDSKFSCSDHNCVIKIKDGCLTKYIYYYLLHNLQLLQNGFSGVGLQNISKQYISDIKLPIPNIEKQNEMVEYLDFIYEVTNKTSLAKIAELKRMNEFCLINQQRFGRNDIKTLGEVCNFKNGKGIKRNSLVEGEYPVIGGGQSPLGFHNEYNTQENTILCSSSGAYAGFISKYEKKVWASDCFSIILKTNSINNKYLYYLLKSGQSKIYKLQSGAAQPHAYSKDLQHFEIHIPDMERQLKLVEYCEQNNILMRHIEKEIERNINQATMFISSIMQETDDISSVDTGDQEDQSIGEEGEGEGEEEDQSIDL